MPRFIVCVCAAAAIALVAVAPSSAAEVKVLGKWRNCETGQAALTYRTTFINPARSYGMGRYLIKSQIRWDKNASDQWRNLDTNTIQTPWKTITNGEFDFSQSHGDRTNWGDWFFRRWRAHVIVKLIKNRPGPKDKRVETVERFFERPMFHERGSCDVSIGS